MVVKLHRQHICEWRKENRGSLKVLMFYPKAFGETKISLCLSDDPVPESAAGLLNGCRMLLNISYA